MIFPRIDLEKELKELEKVVMPVQKKQLPELRPQITIDDFAKLDPSRAVISCEKVENRQAAKAAGYRVETRQVVSGIASITPPRKWWAKRYLIANLKPPLWESNQGMILAATDKEDNRLVLATVSDDIPVGCQLS